MKAIVVRYLEATTHHGARMRASADGIRAISRPYDYGQDTDEQAFALAHALAAQLGWPTKLASGTLPNGDFVFIPLSARVLATA